MANYISSNNERFYTGVEASYGVAPAAGDFTRIPAVSLKAQRQRERLERRDKTGTRTYLGLPSGNRYRTTFELNTYMTGWVDSSRPPVHDGLLRAALGASGRTFNGGIAAVTSDTQVRLQAPHGLRPGQAIAYGGEIRFVTGITDTVSVRLNAAFAAGPAAGDAIRPAITYGLAEELQSLTVLDCWSPDSSVQRMLAGAAVDNVQIDINGDFHEFRFSGTAADLIDSASFEAGQAGQHAFPAEPVADNFDYTILPGHLGQAWIGSIPSQFLSLAKARVTLSNNIDLRAREFGYLLPKLIVPGQRDVRVDFSVYAQDDDDTKALYQAARQQSPVSVMFQLGSQPGRLCGVYLNSVMVEAPEFDDGETRLIWNFKSGRAQGAGDDEIAIAFA